MNIKNSAAQELGRRRWQGVGAEARSQHAKYAVAVRERKRASVRADAKAQIPKNIESLLTRAEALGSPSAYYNLGYRLGWAQRSATLRNRSIRSLERKRHALWHNEARHLSLLERRTLDAMREPLVVRLLLDVAKVLAWDGRKPSTSLRAIFKDSAIVTLVPRLRHGVFLTGLRAGAAGDIYHQAKRKLKASSSVIKR